MRILTIIMVMLASLIAYHPAKAAESQWLTTDFVKMRLISASETAGQNGVLSLGLEMVLADGWKTYWRTPGDAGLPPAIFLDPIIMPQSEAEIYHPLPKRFSLFGLDTFGYSERVIFPIDLTLGDLRQAQDIQMQVEALVCSDICVPVQGKLSLSLAQGAQRASIYGQELAKIRALLPKSVKGAASVHLAHPSLDDKALGHLVVVLQEAQEVYDILVEGIDGVSFAPPQPLSNSATNNSYLLKKIAGNAAPVSGQALTITIDAQARPLEVPVTIQPAIKGERHAQTGFLPLWLIALIGGFILNFMPCVLPVLSIKIASVISLGGASSQLIRTRFFASAAGIITSFILLAFALQLLRAAGGQIGWGIQFQSPWFLAGLVIVTGLFTLSLFDVITLRTPSFVTRFLPRTNTPSEGSIIGDFGAGMLATLLATPCSAPFVGTAVSFALAQSDSILYGMMVMMGIGLALPWLMLALFPRLVGFLPRPGQWMVTLKKGLGVLMALTVIWVASLFYNTVQPAKDISQAADENWVTFTPELLAKMRDDGQTIFVDVTADWCITCNANKAFVLNTDAAKRLFDAQNVILMRADWTYPDGSIANYLASHQRFGIPFNIVYGKAAPDGVILPEILTLNLLENAVLAANQSP